MINENMDSSEHTSFQDDSPSDRRMNKLIEDERQRREGGKTPRKLDKGVIEDIDEDSGEVYSKNLMEDDIIGEEDIEYDYDPESDPDFDPDNDDDFVTRH